MLIRSQNKEVLVVMSVVEIVYAKKNVLSKEIEYQIIDEGYVLGTYSTKEKAEKVLDKIQEAHDDFMYRPYLATAVGVRPEFAYCPPKTFQMPQDSEV